MKKIRWQLIIIFLTGLVVGLLLLGEQPTKQIQTAPEPVKGGIYTEAVIGNMQRLNPVLDFNNSVDHDLDRLIYSGLVKFDERGIPQPDLADYWGISQDGRYYNFTLRANALWHDGQPVTSEDVVFTIDLMREGGTIVPSDVQELWKAVKVVALSKDTLQFQLPEPYAPFLDYLTFGLLPKHLLSSLSFDELVNAPFNLSPIGSGPFRFEKMISEDGSVVGVGLASYDKYYGQKPFIDQMVFRFFPDSETALQAYRDGIVQGISLVTTDVLGEALAEPELAVYTGRTPELSLVLFNLKSQEAPFFQDVLVRQALMMGLNRQRMINTILDGQAILANGVIFPGTWAYYDGIKAHEYDPDAAKSLLKQAGYVLSGETETIRKKDEQALSFKLSYPDDDAHRGIAEAIQKDWSDLNIQVDLEPVPYDVLLNDSLANRTYQAALVDLNLARTPDPDPYPFWDQAQATNGQNYTQWDNRVASEYLEQARTSVDLGERIKLYRNFQVIFDENLPALPLYYPVTSSAIDKQVQGVRIGPLLDTSDRFASVTSWFLKERRTGTNSEPTATP